MSLLAIDLGGTKLAAGIFSHEGELRFKQELPVAGNTGHAVGKIITSTIQSLMNSEHAPVEAIGISVPGISNRKNGTVWAPNIPGWEQYPLLSEVQAIAGNIPVSVDSDRSCYILGEMWQGNAKGAENAIFIAVGTGIGAGIVCDGHLIHGASDIAGAIGWMALHHPYSDEYIPCGCFELNASGAGLAKMARKFLEDSQYDGFLSKKDPNEITAHDIFVGYDINDEISVKVIGNAITHWGMAIANLISIFNPEKILLGGGVFGPATRFIPAIHEEAMKWAQPISVRQVSVEPSLLGGSAGIYGAGYLALQLLNK
ncbi:MAG: ROK family protein [Chitinophagaceae bacterium]|nr:ROK family protein [Chitinophagaceae bacterium]